MICLSQFRQYLKVLLAITVSIGIIAFPWISAPVGAEQAISFTLTPGHFSNNRLPIDVNIAGFPQGQAVIGFNQTISFDPSKVQYSSFNTGDFLSNWTWMSPVVNNTAGTVTFSAAKLNGSDPATAAGRIMTVNFKAISTGSITLTPSSINLRDSSNQAISVTGTPVTTSINSLVTWGTIEGFVRKNAKQGSGHGNITVTLKDTQYAATTNDSGYFEIAELPAGTYTLVFSSPNYLSREVSNVVVETKGLVSLANSEYSISLWAGDLDGKSGINATDLSLLIASFGKPAGDPNYDARVDFDGQNGVNATDLSTIISHFGKATAEYPQWTWN